MADLFAIEPDHLRAAEQLQHIDQTLTQLQQKKAAAEPNYELDRHYNHIIKMIDYLHRYAFQARMHWLVPTEPPTPPPADKLDPS